MPGRSSCQNFGQPARPSSSGSREEIIHGAIAPRAERPPRTVGVMAKVFTQPCGRGLSLEIIRWGLHWLIVGSVSVAQSFEPDRVAGYRIDGAGRDPCAREYPGSPAGPIPSRATPSGSIGSPSGPHSQPGASRASRKPASFMEAVGPYVSASYAAVSVCSTLSARRRGTKASWLITWQQFVPPNRRVGRSPDHKPNRPNGQRTVGIDGWGPAIGDDGEVVGPPRDVHPVAWTDGSVDWTTMAIPHRAARGHTPMMPREPGTS